MLRLLWPTAVYLVVDAVVVTVARIADADKAALARAGWLAALHLWFLPVHLLLIALAPLLLAAYRLWGLAVPAVTAVAAVGVDALVLGPHLPLLVLLTVGVMRAQRPLRLLPSGL